MWMKSRFATWEAEGQVRERVDSALQQTEQWRLAQQGKSGQARHGHGILPNFASFRLPQLASLGDRICMLFDGGFAERQNQTASAADTSEAGV